MNHENFQILKDPQREFAIFPNAIFIRPHHIEQWQYLHYSGFNRKTKQLDKDWFIKKLCQDMLRDVKTEIIEVLKGSKPINHIGLALESLQLIQNPSEGELTEKDKLRLNEALKSLSVDSFLKIANMRATQLFDCYIKPDDTKVVVTHMLDDICKMLSSDGCSHCHVSDNQMGLKYDHKFLLALEYMKKNFDDLSAQIEIKYDSKGSIKAVTIPLSFLKDENICSEIIQIAINLIWNPKKSEYILQ